MSLWKIIPKQVRKRIEAPYRFEAEGEIKRELEDLKESIDVLDAGAGDRFAEEWFEGHNYTAMDVASSGKKDVDVVSDVRKTPFPDNKFDMVIMLEVLEYLEDPDKALSEMKRILKKGGCFIISVPLMVPFHKDLHRYTKPAFISLLENRGFEVERFMSVGGYWRSLGYLFSKLPYFTVRKPKSKILLPLYYLVEIPLILIFQIIFPLILFYLDRFDKEKKYTSGYLAVTRKK